VIDTYLAEFPQNGFRDRRRKLYHYPVTKTPFTVVYEYDNAELRVLFIVHQHADRRRLDPKAVEW
jgi:hypothetical protein